MARAYKCTVLTDDLDLYLLPSQLEPVLNSRIASAAGQSLQQPSARYSDSEPCSAIPA